jgi:signal peptidase II
MTAARKLAIFVGTTAVAAAVDLGTKALAFSRVQRDAPVTVIDGFLRLVLSENRGAAFGVLQNAFAFFILVSVGALFLLAYFSVAAKHASVFYEAALGLVGGGVVGNLYDRLALGHVRDFIGVYAGYPPIAQRLRAWFGTNEWPIFNAADAFICVGAAALLVAFWREERRERASAGAAAHASDRHA